LLSAYQGFERRVATFYDLSGIPLDFFLGDVQRRGLLFAFGFAAQLVSGNASSGERRSG